MSTKRLETGYTNKPDEFKPCPSEGHNPPLYLYVPPGQNYTHSCPDCGKVQQIRGEGVTY